MLKYALLAAGIAAAAYVVANALYPQQSTLQTIVGAGKNLFSALGGGASGVALQHEQTNASESMSSARTVAGQTPYGTKSTQDGDAAISDAMGVASARAMQVAPNLFQTKAQVVLGGGALGASPFVRG